MSRFRYLLLIATLCAPSLGSTTIINVPGDQATIQAGINASSAGDTVLVDTGLYVENIDFNDHSIVLCSRFLTTGDTSYISSTIIDGDSSGLVITIRFNEDSTTVVAGFTLQNGYATDGGGVHFDAPGVSLRNLVIKDNAAEGNGGGVYLSPWFSSERVSMVDCTVRGNASGLRGGGIYSHLGTNCTLYISGCVIEDNTGFNKGGGFYSSTASVLTHCTFSGNTVSQYASEPWAGGGFFGENVAFTFDSCVFVGNTAGMGGGLALRNIQIGATIENCSFDSNTALSGYAYGGAIALGDDQNQVNHNCTIRNTTVTRNVSVYGGGISIGPSQNTVLDHCLITENTGTHAAGIYIQESPADSLVIASCTMSDNHSLGNLGVVNLHGGCQVRNTLVSSNTSDGSCGGIRFVDATPVTYGDVYDNAPNDFAGSIPIGLGVLVDVNANGDSCDASRNILMDPLFCDTSSGDYQLEDSSPCLGAGDAGTHIGAFGVGCISVDVADGGGAHRPRQFGVLQNYPNPFNPATTIEYNLSAPGHVTIAVYNLLGQKVRALVDEQRPAGLHSTVWDGTSSSGESVATGIYLYRLQTGDCSETRRMLLLR
jgi:hypothetical protein